MPEATSNKETLEAVFRHWETVRAGIEFGFSPQTILNVIRCLEELS